MKKYCIVALAVLFFACKKNDLPAPSAPGEQSLSARAKADPGNLKTRVVNNSLNFVGS
jgi:hypothetical protein